MTKIQDTTLMIPKDQITRQRLLKTLQERGQLLNLESRSARSWMRRQYQEQIQKPDTPTSTPVLDFAEVLKKKANVTGQSFIPGPVAEGDPRFEAENAAIQRTNLFTESLFAEFNFLLRQTGIMGEENNQFIKLILSNVVDSMEEVLRNNLDLIPQITLPIVNTSKEVALKHFLISLALEKVLFIDELELHRQLKLNDYPVTKRQLRMLQESYWQQGLKMNTLLQASVSTSSKEQSASRIIDLLPVFFCPK